MALEKRLFLLDAYALIFRGYYAFIKNPRINSKGMNTSAIMGFMNSLLDVINREKPEYLAVAFDNFDYTIIANYGQQKISELITDDRIIKNKLKINAAVTNAKAFMEVQKEFGSFSKYIWSFTNGEPIVNYPKVHADIPAQTPLSVAISKDLKKRGFKFVGPTIMYAFMQAVGIVDDHISDCWVK